MYFLVADTQLYKRLCPSVGRSVRRSVGPSVRGHESKSEEMSVLEHLLLRTVALPPLPTHPQLMAVYPALFFYGWVLIPACEDYTKQKRNLQ